MTDKNWKGQKRHAVDSYCWFRTDDKDREMMKQLYDRVIGKNKDAEGGIQQELRLQELIEMAREQMHNEDEFDFDGRE